VPPLAGTAISTFDRVIVFIRDVVTINGSRGAAIVCWCAVAILSMVGKDPAHAADPQPYTLSIASTANADLDAALKASSQLGTFRDSAPVGPFGLVIRARNDVPRLEAALQSFGYYNGTVRIRIDGRDIADPTLLPQLSALPNGKSAAVAVAVTTGPQFHLHQVTINGTVSEEARRKLGLAPGRPAIAADVLAGRTRLLTELQEEGYALAKVDQPIAHLDPQTDGLDITFDVDEGPKVELGTITLKDLHDVNESFVRRRLLVHPGELFQPSKIEAARKDLASLPVFSGVSVRVADHLDPDGRLPLTFDFQERAKYSVGFTAAYSTDLGGIPKVSWTARNLFGNAEQLNITGAATGLGGDATRGLGYNLTSQFVKPDFLERDQSLQFNVGAVKQDLEAYDQTAFSAGPSLHRKINDRWAATIGVSVAHEHILQEEIGSDFNLVGLPVTLTYDSTDLADPLLDPTHGVRMALSATPTQSFGHSEITFAILQASASTYKDLADFGWTKPGRSVVAVRGLVGSIQGASTFDLPPDQRFYGGGSGTVRGYKYQSVGPLFPDSNPIGGVSIDAGTIEFRQRLFGDFGAATFIDAGQVNSNSLPFRGTPRVGAGVGIRYYTPIGALRADVAVPVNPEAGADSYEFYLGIGQAF